MSLRPVVRISLALVVAVGVQVAQGAPSRTLQTLRAMRCCRATCHHGGGTGAAERCCGVVQSDADSAAKTPTWTFPPPVASCFARGDAVQPARPDRCVAGFAAVGPPRGRAAPVFLANLTLLI